MLDNIEVSPPAILALAKGPKFTLSPKVSREDLQHRVQIETAALAYALRWNAVIGSSAPPSQTIDAFQDLKKSCPFNNQRKEPPRTHTATEKTIQRLQMDLQRLVENCDLQIIPNLSREEKDAILAIRSRDDTIVTKSDKGGEMVVMKASHLKQLCQEHLADTNTYRKLTRNPTKNIRIRINNTLCRILSDRNFPTSLIYQLQTPSSARTQRFYALPKTHKAILKIRPIVSACGGIFERLGWLLQSILKPLIKQVAAHLSDTAELIKRFEATDCEDLKGKFLYRSMSFLFIPT